MSDQTGRSTTREKQNPFQDKPAAWLGIGVALGAGIGVAMGNIALGVSIGLAIGAGVMFQLSSNKE